MAAIFDAPVTADRVGKLLDAHCQTADVVACLRGLFAVANTSQGSHADRLQTFPQLQSTQSLRYRHLDITADLLTAVSGFFGRVPASLGIGKVVFALLVDVVDDGLLQGFLVSFQSQNIVCFAANN